MKNDDDESNGEGEIGMEGKRRRRDKEDEVNIKRRRWRSGLRWRGFECMNAVKGDYKGWEEGD